MHLKNISILDYTYELPAERLPCTRWQNGMRRKSGFKDGEIKKDRYKQVLNTCPRKPAHFQQHQSDQARVLFKSTGVIEIFWFGYQPRSCNSTGGRKTKWKCMIGGAKMEGEEPGTKNQ